MKNIPNYVWYIIGAIIILLILGYFMRWIIKKSSSSAYNASSISKSRNMNQNILQKYIIKGQNGKQQLRDYLQSISVNGQEEYSLQVYPKGTNLSSLKIKTCCSGISGDGNIWVINCSGYRCCHRIQDAGSC